MKHESRRGYAVNVQQRFIGLRLHSVLLRAVIYSDFTEASSKQNTQLA